MSGKLRIGVSCYPTYGGSGIVATELGMELARRGHQVHFICSDAPRRFAASAANVFLHEVKPPAYPLFGGDNQYALALASKMVEATLSAKLDLLHVHYAIPHAAAAGLARQILGARAPKLVTTLHGTDITVVGGDPSFLSGHPLRHRAERRGHHALAFPPRPRPTSSCRSIPRCPSR